MTQRHAPGKPDGHWQVRRISGLLPPGVTKRIVGQLGQTLIGGRLFGTFDVVGDRFVYRFWPIVDMVTSADGDTFVGRGLFLGVQFCRFRLERMADAEAATRLPATGSGRSGTES